MTIEIIQQDITILKIDAIVNAANTSLLGGGGVDGAIHRVAGEQLLQACRLLNGANVGSAKITPGFNLPAKWVIHAVGPVWRGGNNQESALLKSCYTTVFEIAKQHQIKSIAFPAISTGIYGFPKKEAAVIALQSMIDHEDQFDKIIACTFSKEDEKIYQTTLLELRSANK